MVCLNVVRCLWPAPGAHTSPELGVPETACVALTSHDHAFPSRLLESQIKYSKSETGSPLDSYPVREKGEAGRMWNSAHAALYT